MLQEGQANLLENPFSHEILKDMAIGISRYLTNRVIEDVHHVFTLSSCSINRQCKNTRL